MEWRNSKFYKLKNSDRIASRPFVFGCKADQHVTSVAELLADSEYANVAAPFVAKR